MCETEVGMDERIYFVILISADAEWRELRKIFPDHPINFSPYGDWLVYHYPSTSGLINPVVFVFGGWGKVAAAGSTQYTISRWAPQLIINIGTCGGFEGDVNKGEIILADRTIIYDIYEQMGDPDEHIQHYSTKIDNDWLSEPLPLEVRRTLLVSGDRDLLSSEIEMLKSKYGAIAGDWESGAIAWVCAKNNTKCLILRGVTDLVGPSGGEAYGGNVHNYYQNTEIIIKRLVDSLPAWLKKFQDYMSEK